MFSDLSGTTFGRWTVVKQRKKRGALGEIYWLCRCQCGTRRFVLGPSLRKGVSTSCGCFSRERSTKHGMEGTRTYNCWAHILDRCRNPNNQLYRHYGGRGIKVCARWLLFEKFYEDMGEMPNGMGIDRINNDGHYTKANCRWASIKQQIRNRRVTPMIQFRGNRMSVAEAAEIAGIRRKVVLDRLKRGLSVDEALSPKRHGRWGQTRSKLK